MTSFEKKLARAEEKHQRKLREMAVLAEQKYQHALARDEHAAALAAAYDERVRQQKLARAEEKHQRKLEEVIALEDQKQRHARELEEQKPTPRQKPTPAPRKNQKQLIDHFKEERRSQINHEL